MYEKHKRYLFLNMQNRDVQKVNGFPIFRLK